MLFMTFFIILVVTVVVLCAAPRYGRTRAAYDGRLNW